MSYFGGLGAGKGWDKFKFVLTPADLRSIFENLNYWFVITNSAVVIDYSITDKDSLFENYKRYYNKIVSGEPRTTKEDSQIESGIRISITDSPAKISFEEICSKKGTVSKEFKRVVVQEPVVNVTPFYLAYENEQLTIQSYNEEGALGLEFNYPKVVSFDFEQHAALHDTTANSNKLLFDNLIARIKERARKAKLVSPAKGFRPNFWISEDSLEEVNRNYYLRRHALKLL